MQIYSFIWKIKRNFAGQIREKRANNVQKRCPIMRNELKERCSSGWRGTPGKRVTGETGSQVRILFSPQSMGRKEHPLRVFFFILLIRPKLVWSWIKKIKEFLWNVFYPYFARAPAASRKDRRSQSCQRVYIIPGTSTSSLSTSVHPSPILSPEAWGEVFGS